MVVIDTSVIVAIFKSEIDAPTLVGRALSYRRRVMSAATWLESAMVCEGKVDLGGGERFDRIVKSLKLEFLPFTASDAHIARDAFKRYGKGRDSKAALSFGDCFVYALAKSLDAPLLFKGNDFIHTDVTPA